MDLGEYLCKKVTKSSLSGLTGLEYHIKEQRDLPLHLKCVLIKSDCWIKSILTSEFCIAFLFLGLKYDVSIQNRQFSVCQGYFKGWAGTFSQGWIETRCCYFWWSVFAVFIVLINYLCIKSSFKHTFTTIHLGLMPKFGTQPLSISLLCVCQQRRLFKSEG